MSMREKIAAHVYKAMIWARTQPKGGHPATDWVEGGNSLAQQEARAQADAIKAALPDMIKPLEWEADERHHWAESVLGTFSINCCPQYGWLVEIDGHDDTWVKYPDSEYGFNTLSDAQKAANAYNVATIMGAFE